MSDNLTDNRGCKYFCNKSFGNPK